MRARDFGLLTLFFYEKFFFLSFPFYFLIFNTILHQIKFTSDNIFFIIFSWKAILVLVLRLFYHQSPFKFIRERERGRDDIGKNGKNGFPCFLKPSCRYLFSTLFSTSLKFRVFLAIKKHVWSAFIKAHVAALLRVGEQFVTVRKNKAGYTANRCH